LLTHLTASGQTGKDPVNVYESNTPIPELLNRYAGSELLGRVTNESVAVNVIAPAGMEVLFEYGTASGVYSSSTSPFESVGGEPIEVTIDDLQPDTQYYYRTKYRLPGASAWAAGVEHSFRTQRPRGSTFIFNVQADSHRDAKSDASVYNKTLINEASDRADFLIDLGDTSMVDKFATSYEEVLRRTIEDRAYFDLPGGSTPLYLAIGNHDGEKGWTLNGSEENMAIWATKTRKAYYPNPFPDSFYSGSTTVEQFVGLRENYYSWTWGDALFVVLDPYWYTTKDPRNNDLWLWTIGNTQYQWLKRTLEGSNSTYKFVFSHHVLGEGRGMTTMAGEYEWGGRNDSGVWEFKEKRPGWELPIHQLMVKNNVTAYFQGHDHIFAIEILDGIAYIEVPQPSLPMDNYASGAEYGYVGDFLGSSGHIRVKVSPSNVTFEYVRSSPANLAGNAYAYTIFADEPPSPPIPEFSSLTLFLSLLVMTTSFALKLNGRKKKKQLDSGPSHLRFRKTCSSIFFFD
jgi:hypothetical protein